MKVTLTAEEIEIIAAALSDLADAEPDDEELVAISEKFDNLLANGD